MATPTTSLTTPSNNQPTARVTPLLWQGLMLLALASCLFFLGLGRLPLLEPDEGRNAEVAREMLTGGNWITPHFDGLTYLDKPPVFFWQVAASLKVWGISEGAARFPSALMAFATLVLVWWWARKVCGSSLALWAAVVFATCPLVIAFARLVIFDMQLAFLMTLAMLAFWLAESKEFREWRLDSLLFAALGLATITKGPVGFIVPLLSIVVYEALRGKLGELKKLRWGLGVAVFLAVVLPWFIAVSVRNPDFPRYALWQESLQRFATGAKVHRRGGIFYYVPVYFAGFFPWSIFLVLAGLNRVKRWRELSQESHRSTLFLLAWVVTVFGFFSVSHSQLPGYFLPAVVPLSILMARACKDMMPAEGRPATAPDWLTAGFAILLGLAVIMAVGSQPWMLGGAKAALAKKHPQRLVAMIWPSLFYTGVILGAMAILGRNLVSRARGRPAHFAVIAGLVSLMVPLLIVRWLPVIRAYAEANSSRRLAETVLASPEKDWPIYGYYYFRPSLPFYLRRPVGLVTFDTSELTSNYLVARFWEVQREKNSPVWRGARTSAEAHLTFAELDPAPLDNRRLVDVLELTTLKESSPRPRMLLVRNKQVGSLGQALGDIEPLWNEWDDSVWELMPTRPAPEEPKPHRVVSPFTP